MVFLAYFGGNILNGVKWVVEKKKNNWTKPKPILWKFKEPDAEFLQEPRNWPTLLFTIDTMIGLSGEI
jgi:hypothetical protein